MENVHGLNANAAVPFYIRDLHISSLISEYTDHSVQLDGFSQSEHSVNNTQLKKGEGF
jgi:hypothetical protein